MSQTNIPSTDLVDQNGNDNQSQREETSTPTPNEVQTNGLTPQVQSLEGRIKELTEENDQLQRENARLEVLSTGYFRIDLNNMSNSTATEAPSVFRISTPSGTSVHQVAAMPRFDFSRAQLSTSLKDIRSPSMLNAATTPIRTPSDTTDIVNTTLTVIYLRKGVRLHNPQFSSCLTASSHASSFVVLQKAPTVPSETSMTDYDEPIETEIQPTIRISTNDFVQLETHRTPSLPTMTGFTSGSNLTTYILDFGGLNRIEAHRSRSWPSHRQIHLQDFTTLLASYLDDSDSEFDLDENLVFEDSRTQINTTAREQENSSLRQAPGPNGPAVVVEQPFTEPLRSVNDQPIGRNVSLVRSGHRLIRRRGISVLPTWEGHLMSSWTRNIRAQLFLNVILVERETSRIREESDANADVSSSVSFVSLNNSLSDISIFEQPELVDPAPEEGHGEQGNPPNEPTAGIAEAPIVPPLPEDESSSSEDSGQGDAESEGSSSSDSMATHAPRPRSDPAPSFPYPSESNLGGKYGYLRAAIRRPRAADGHRFVVSLFGTMGRRNNEQSLPSWVPVYANRLECILNQILDKKESTNRNSPALQVLQNSVRSRSVQSYRSIVTFTDSQENQVDSREFPALRRPRQLKSCLRVSREGSTGESIPKNLSWSQKVSVCRLDAQRPPSPKTEEVVKNPSRTQSCPDVILTSVFNGQESRGVMTMPVILNPVELVEYQKNGGGRRTKNGFASKFVRRFLCSCGKDLQRSSSLDCGLNSR